MKEHVDYNSLKTKEELEKYCHVYCTDCKYSRGLFDNIMGKGVMPVVCENCYPYNPEDSTPKYIRPNYTPMVSVTVNGLTFTYYEEEFEITDEVMAVLDSFKPDDDQNKYFMYWDEDPNTHEKLLIIY